MIDVLADAANWQNISSGDIVLPRWVVYAAAVLGGIAVLLNIISAKIIPALFKIVGQLQTGLRDVMATANTAKGMADILNSRADKIADHVQSVDRAQTETVAKALQQVTAAATNSPPTPSAETIAAAATAAANTPEKP